MSPNVSYTANLGAPQQTQGIIPKQFRPTKKFITILGIIILAVIAYGLFQFPYASLMNGNTDVSVDIGFPFPFLQFSLSDPNQFPLNISGFLIDILIYIVISYAIDIIIGLIINNPTQEQSTETSPQIFKDQTIQTQQTQPTQNIQNPQL